MAPSPAISVHQILTASRANGPGLRAVLWLQGCTLACPGCFNPATHPFTSGHRMPVSHILRTLLDPALGIEGVTLSGGEPFQQAPALAVLLRELRQSSPLSVLAFSGYTFAELMDQPAARDCLSYVDVLIAGRYERRYHLGAGLLGSSNKKIHFLTPRYSARDLAAVPDAEVLIQPNGEVFLSGISPLDWQERKTS